MPQTTDRSQRFFLLLPRRGHPCIDRRDGQRCPLRRPHLRLPPVPVLDDSCSHPLLNQPQHPLVRDTVLEEPPQPRVIKLAEEVADVRGVRCWPCSPWPVPFPPPPPPPLPRPCPAGSQVLRDRPTAHTRSSQAYRLSVPWTAHPLIRRVGGHGLSRFSRMKVPYMPWFFDRAGSATGSR